MERVETLLKKLQEQVTQQASPDHLLLTVQMLQAEILLLKQANAPGLPAQPVAVTVSNLNNPGSLPVKPALPTLPNEEKTVEILQVDEAEIEAELEEIKRNAENLQQISNQNKPQIVFEPEDDIPTLSHQQAPAEEPTGKWREVNESVLLARSLNEKLKQTEIDLGDTLTEAPIRDLRKAIGVNDRYLFINDLFRGDEAVYERSIKTINSFSIFAEAEYWIQRELKIKNGWNDSDSLVKQFYQLVKRRFS